MSQPRVIQVTDQLERRIRKPIDALRSVTSCIWIFVLAVAAVAASAITTGVETDIVGASKRLPHALLVVVPPIALFALFMLPAALAVAQVVRRQARTLAEAVATGLVAAIVAQVANVLLAGKAERLYYAIIMSRPHASHINALDPYLAGLIAYTTIIGLSRRPGWRNTLTLAIGVYVIVELTAARTTILAILITLLAGSAIGLAIRYAAGSITQRPVAADIAAALSAGDLAVTAIRRVPQPPAGVAGSRLYDVVTDGGDQLDAVVFDRDQQAAGAFYRLYRWVRVRGQVSRAAPLSVERTVERRALLTYAAVDAGAPTPRLRTLVRVGPDAVVLAYDQCPGTTLAQRDPGCTDEDISRVWDAVGRLHAHHVTHRALTADRILFTPDGQVMLLDPGDGEVAASDLQIHLDMAQLIAELALYVGPDRSARLAVSKVGASGLVTVLPLLQPVVLARSTRHALRRRRDVLPAVRKALLAAVPAGEADEMTPVQLERIRPRALVTLVASVAASYLLAGELAQASLGRLLPSTDWRWGLAALVLSAVTYAAAALSLSGFVAERLSFARTLLVQLASSFVALVTPAAVGGATLNVRYLQRRKIPAPVAVASVGVSQVVAFVLHIVLLATFAAIAGTGSTHPIRPPTWAYFVVAGLVAVAGAVLAVPAGRRMVRARLSPTFGQVIPQLLEIAQRPRKLAMGFGGAITLSLTYILCLATCVAAFGGSVPIAKIGVVYLTGATLGSIIPTPGGLGTVEAALSAGLTAAGVPSGVAISAVLLFRLVTFWLPVPVGWVALNFLERHHDLLEPYARVRRPLYRESLVPEGDEGRREKVALVRVLRAAKAGGRERAAAVAVTVMVALLAAACTSSTHEAGGTSAGTAAPAASTGPGSSAGGSPSASPTPAGPAVAVSPADGAPAADPSAGVTVTATRGTLKSVTVTPTGTLAADNGNPSGPVPGMLSPSGTSWHTTWALGVSQQYTVTAVATGEGTTKTTTSTFTTLKPAATFSTNIFEGNDQTYGVGMPLILTFSQPITDKAAVERSLQIKTSKPVVGAWYWDTSESLAFRPRSYWPPNTTVSFTGHLDGIKAGPGLYGYHTLTQTFTIGQSVIAVASTKSHHTQIYVGGKLKYTWPISSGRPGDATPNGTYLTIEKENPVRMTGPGYSLEVPWSVRFTWSGDYYHDAYWSVGEQGFENVSHGCVNLPPAAAETYYKLAVPGDPITITNSPKAGTPDNGWTEWFLTWNQLLAGSATHQAVEAGPSGSTFVTADALAAIHVTAPLESAATGVWGNGPAT